jgi:transcriptional regulator with XRE-family HTH domain
MDSESKEEVQILDSNEVEAVPEAPPDIPQSEDANPLVRLRNCKGLSQRDFGALLGYPLPRYSILEKGYWPALPENLLKYVSKLFDDPNDQKAQDRLDDLRMGGRFLKQEERDELAALAEKGRIIANRLQADWRVFRSGLSKEFLDELTKQLYPLGKENGIKF